MSKKNPLTLKVLDKNNNLSKSTTKELLSYTGNSRIEALIDMIIDRRITHIITRGKKYKVSMYYIEDVKDEENKTCAN